MDQGHTLDAIGLIYEAAYSPAAWADCMDRMARSLGAAGGQFVLCDVKSLMVYESQIVGYERELADLYNNLYVRIDPRAPYFFGNLGKAVSSAKACSRRTFKTSQIYTELLKPHRAEEIMLISALEGEQCGFLGMIRPEAKGSFKAKDVAALSAYLPHFQRAHHIRHKLTQNGAVGKITEAALDALAVGIVLIGGAGRIVFANRRARGLVAANDGLSIRGDKLVAARNSENKELLDRISDAINPRPEAGAEATRGLRVSRPSLKPPYTLLAASLMNRPEGVSSQAVAIVFISDPDMSCARADHILKEWYSLTQGEARLAGGLLAGKSLEDLSAEFGVAMPTLRTQLSAVFSKTNTRRQSDLVRLLSMQLGSIGS
jgi:DNA-binding CsgD family transcriptional regulator